MKHTAAEIMNKVHAYGWKIRSAEHAEMHGSERCIDILATEAISLYEEIERMINDRESLKTAHVVTFDVGSHTAVCGVFESRELAEQAIKDKRLNEMAYNITEHDFNEVKARY